LVYKSFGSAEQMRVVLGESPHAQQPVKHARHLVSVDRSELGITKRQISIRPLIRFVDAYMERAIHRSYAIGHLIHLHRSEHTIGVVLLVAGDHPQIPLCDLRSEYKPVSVLDQHRAQEVLDLLAHYPALRMPEYESRSVVFLDAEEIEFPS